MNHNKNSVQTRIKTLSQKFNTNVNVLLATYFFEAFLYRLSKSEYCKKFIFKGGFYLSSVIGIQNRYTRDLDFKLTGETLEKENLQKIITEIISQNIDDNIIFELSSVEPIRDEDLYGGYTITLTGHFENIRQVINIDIATGDPITPNAIEYKYKRLIEQDTLDFMAYNLETILAEKLQTIFSRGLLNSRSKDFYDVYIIQKLKSNEINRDNLKAAFQKTCDYRNTHFTKNEIEPLLAELKENTQISIHWKNYARKNNFAKDILFTEIMEECTIVNAILFEN